MNHGNTLSLQRGVALVLSLLILLVLTVIGVAAMNSTIMQERMAGNAKTQADVFEKASEGVNRSLELFYNHAGNFTFGPYDLSCGQVFGGTLDEDNAEAWSYPEDGGWHPASGVDDNPKLEQRMYCCRSWERVDTTWVESPSKLYALNRATFMGGADGTQSLALREIEVEMAEGEPDDPTCAICAPGNVNNVDGANSRQFSVSGACGAAIVTESTDARDMFIDGIPSNRIGNYTGGIVRGDMAAPWNTPAGIAEFVFWAKLGLPLGTSAADIGVGDSNVRGLYVNGNYTDNGNRIYGRYTSPGVPDTNNPPLIIYIDGDAKFGGNISGAGILIVRGKLTWGGTPDFDGLIISLGGFATDGAGQGEPNGSMVITDLDYNNPPYPNDPLYGRDVLHYEIARDNTAQEVRVYNRADYASSSDVRKATGTGFIGSGAADDVPPRPILVDNNNRGLIHYATGDATQPHRFFNASDGSEVAELVSMDGSNFQFIDPADGTTVLATMLYQAAPTRDAFGRLIPDFLQVDNYPAAYGYRPNEWGWDPDVANARFAWGVPGASFDWSGGGRGSITYDCRMLQQVRHGLLCQQPLQSLPSEPSDDFYKDPESHYADYCWHSVAGIDGGTDGALDGKYFEDYASPPDPPDVRPENQMAWHMWSPSCDCLGISTDADMIISGWRENLGWRDDNDFLGCSGLPSPSGN